MLIGKDLLREIETEIDIMDPDVNSEPLNPAITDLKLKYAILQELKDISIQLFEISHYGIGTD